MSLGISTGSLSTAHVQNLIDQPPAFGQFWCSATQYANTANTIYALHYNSTDGHNLVDLGLGVSNSMIFISKTGWYNLQFSLQLDNTPKKSTLYFWFRKNGIDIPSTSGVWGSDSIQMCIQSWNTLVECSTIGDYFQLMVVSDTDNVTIPTLPAQTTPFAMPESPSIIMSVVPVGA